MNQHLGLLISLNLMLLFLCFKLVFGSYKKLKFYSQCLLMPHTEVINRHWGCNLNTNHKFRVVLAFMLILTCVEIFIYF